MLAPGANAPPGAHLVRPPMLGVTPGPLKAGEVAPALKRPYQKKKKAASERSVQEEANHVIPESSLFNSLLTQERKLDHAIKRRRIDLQDALQAEHIKKRLRLYMYNTHANQTTSSNSQEPPSWTFTIHGRVMEPPQQAPAYTLQGLYGQPPPPSTIHRANPLFTAFMKRVEVEVYPEKGKQQQGEQLTAAPEKRIVWEKALHKGPHKEMLQVHCAGREAATIKVKLEVDWTPMRYLVPPGLAQALNLQYDTRARISSALWSYVRREGLQSPQQPSILQLNPVLAACFGQQQMEVTTINNRLNALLKPVGPIEFSHSIKLDGPSPTHPDCYDLEVYVPMKGHEKIATSIDAISADKEIESYDERISKFISRLNEHRRRRNFFLGFSTSPVDFINAIIASQARDLRVAKGLTGRDFQLESRSDTFKDKWVEEAVVKYLQRQAGTSLAPL